ncbi:MAG: hypothetical protein V3V80_01225 [Dehalococcoidia bacterium]
MIGYQGMVIHVVPITDSSSIDDILAQLYESSPQELSLDEWLAQFEPTTEAARPDLRLPVRRVAAIFRS